MKKVLLVLMLLCFGFTNANNGIKKDKVKEVNELVQSDLVLNYAIKINKEINYPKFLDKNNKSFGQAPPCSFMDSNNYNTESIMYSVPHCSWVWLHTVGGAFTITPVSDAFAVEKCANSQKIKLAGDE